MKGQWKDYAKSAIGQAVLHVTKIAEEARNADPGMYSHTVSIHMHVPYTLYTYSSVIVITVNIVMAVSGCTLCY